MTPEQKAREIATQFGMWPDGSFAVIMATAIRDCEREALAKAVEATWNEASRVARNEALEEAAKVAAKLADQDSMDAERIAARILALKDKSE
jgi:ABC-type nitrate/sulfonate/bicarbonate transport system substrate-binding protein